MEDNLVLCERRGPVAIITLNRPDKRNAVNRGLQVQLGVIMRDLETDDSCLVLIVTGAGDKAFCAGADMGEALDNRTMERRPEPPAPAPPPSTGGETSPEALPPNGVALLSRSAKPVIGAINGYAYGLGAQLSVSTDIRICSTNAKFRFVGASYGLVVSGADLPRVVGPARAKELIFTTRVVEADEALRIGLANQVVEPHQLLPTAIAMAEQIAANSPYAVRWAKRVIDAASTIDRGREVEAEAGRTLRGTTDNSSRFRAAAERVTGRTQG